MRRLIILATALTFAVTLNNCTFFKRLFGFGDDECSDLSDNFSIALEAPEDTVPDTGKLFLTMYPDTVPDTGELILVTYPDTQAMQAELLVKLMPDTFPDTGFFKMTMPPDTQQKTGAFVMRINPDTFPDTGFFLMTLQPGLETVTGMLIVAKSIDTTPDTGVMELTFQSGATATSSSSDISQPCAIFVSNPVDGESFAEGQTYEIKWTSEGAGTTVKIELFKGGSLQCVIVPSTENDGSFVWHVGDCGGGSGSDYQIKITDLGT